MMAPLDSQVSITPIRRLALAVQDTLICGVVMAQVAGLATALRIAGVAASLRLFARN